MALTLPDICASLEAENGKTNGEKYCAWFNRYLTRNYIIKPNFDGDKGRILFSAKECYAARCSFLHEGTNITAHQRILDGVKKAAPSVSFVANTMIRGVSRNDHQVFLDVGDFCQNMIIAVEMWIEEHKSNKIVSDKIADLPNVYSDTTSLPFVYTIAPG